MDIRAQWDALAILLNGAFLLTIFGYGAPDTDVDAMRLMGKGWGSPDARAMEEIEIIDRPGCDEDEMKHRWRGLIHSHHYQVHDNFFDSMVAHNPRRSVETQTKRFYGRREYESNRAPVARTLEELRSWYSVLVDGERRDA